MAREQIHPVYCSELAQLLQAIFGMAASIAIAAIVGIVTFVSPKKGAILVGSIAGLLAALWFMSELSYLSVSTMPSNVMRPMTGFERTTMILLQSQIPVFLLGSEVLGVIVFLVILSRKRLAKPF